MLDKNIDGLTSEELQKNDNNNLEDINAETKNNSEETGKDSINTTDDKADEKEILLTGSKKKEESKEITDNPENETIENKDDEDASDSDKEKQVKKSETVKELPNYEAEKLNLDELADAVQNLLLNFPIQSVKNQIESLKISFNKKFRNFIAEKKEEFLKQGGEEIDFRYDAPVKKRFNDLIYEFKNKRKAFYKNLENEQKQNLNLKLDLIEKLKELIDTAEPSTMYKNFRALQDEWRKIGQIPHNKYNDVWRTYHHHVERFYDLLHLNNDFRDLDFKHNLEEKTKLAERAEELAEHKDVNHAFKELQILHKIWKEDIGPVGREMREEIWNRFSEATKKIHHKRHELQEKNEAKLVENIAVKLAIIDKIKNINIDEIKNHKQWQEGIKKLESLRDEFFAAGRVPKSKNEEIWQLFKDATKRFNKAKNSFYKSIKKDQLSNLDKKNKLVEQAESLKDSEDWDSATEVFKKIQADWKSIGHVPRKDSDRIWKKFKDACNHFFDRLHEKQNGTDKEKIELFNKKKVVLEDIKERIDQADDLTLDMVNTFTKEWRELGSLPVKLRHIDSKFNKVLDSAYKKLNIDKDEALFLKFKNTIENFVNQNDTRKVDNEQLFVRRKVDELTKEIKQLENNISFISNATEDNPLIKNVYKNIKKYQDDLEVWKKKLNYLNHLDY